MFLSLLRTRRLALFVSLTLALVFASAALSAPKAALPAPLAAEAAVKTSALAGSAAANQLVIKSLKSEWQFNYSGTQVVSTGTLSGSNTEICRVYHKKPDKYRTELELLGADGNLITIDDSESVWTYRERGSAATQDDSPAAGSALVPWQKRLKLIEANYDAELQGYSKVAGRSGGIVVLYPRWSHSAQAAWRFWVDTETGITLRSERYNSDGEPIEVRYFTEIKVNHSIADSVFRPDPPKGAEIIRTRQPKLARSLDELSAKAKAPLKFPQKLPMGFEFVWGSVRKQDDQSIVRLRYTDGLVAVSIYESFPPSGTKTRALEMSGNTSIYEFSTDAADVAIVADMGPDDLFKLASEALGSMGIQLEPTQSQARSVQDRVQNRLKSLWKMLGLPRPDAPK